MLRKHSKDIVKMYMWHLWFKLQEYFFVCKENKNNDFIQQFFSSASTWCHFGEYHNACVCFHLNVNKAQCMHVLRKQLHTHTDTFQMALGVACCLWEGQRALGFHHKYLNLCSEDERRFYGFGLTWGWGINDRIFIFGWTIPLNQKRHCATITSLLSSYNRICSINKTMATKSKITFSERSLAKNKIPWLSGVQVDHGDPHNAKSISRLLLFQEIQQFSYKHIKKALSLLTSQCELLLATNLISIIYSL